ncbi:terminase small subunit [Paraburkholderia sp. CNPSo 3272]|nr:terminase small subunit [Paraburkholderia sp. CNPSo 3272]
MAAQRIESESKAAPAKKAAADRSPPPDFDPYAMTSFMDPKAFLIAAMNDGRTEPKLRVDAAKALMPFVHAKVGETGKKDAKGAAAEKAANKFAALAAPKLIVNNRK